MKPLLKSPAAEIDFPALVARAPGAPPPGSGLQRIPGERGLPVLGQTVEYFREPGAWCVQRYEQYGPVSWGSLAGTPMVFALGPDAWDAVQRNKDRAIAAGAGWGRMIGPFFTRGLLLLDFEEHLFHKRIMQQAFGRERLLGYLDAMNPAIAHGISQWQPGGRFLASTELKKLTLDVATRVFMGGELGPEADAINEAFTDCVYAGSSIVRFRLPGSRFRLPGTRWARGLDGRKVLEEYFFDRLPEKRASTDNDLFSVLCRSRSDDGDTFSDVDVVNHMIFLMMAAHDTTMTTMTTMIYQLGTHPEWQQRCRDESDALDKPVLEFTDLDRLTSHDMVMKESLRLVSPIPHLARKTVRDTDILGYFVPKNTYVVAHPQLTHQLAEIWPEPATFDPERFSPERAEDKVHKSGFVPFGAGVHKCIGMYFAGMEIKATLHQLLQRFDWSVDPDYEIPWDRKTLPMATDGLPITLRRLS